MIVSVGIPFLNAKTTLTDAIRSVFSQTISDWELILVDDGSTDGSADLCRQITDPRVRLLADGCHRGLVPRLNQIIGEAKGTYLARMDADDLMHPERLRTQIHLLESDPDLDVVSSGVCSIGERGELFGVRALDTDPPSLLEIFQRGGIIHASIVSRRSWSQAHLYDSSFPRAEDRELWVRTHPNSRFGKIPEPLYFVREVGQFNIRKFRAAYRSERSIIKRYGPGMIGSFRALVLFLRSHGKGFLASLLHLWGGANRLMVGRSQTATIEQEKDYRKALRRIADTRIPGVD